MALPTADQLADEMTIQEAATNLLADYAEADSDVRLAIPPTVPTALSQVQTAAQTNDPKLLANLPQIKQLMETLLSDVLAASVADDPNDPSVGTLRTDTQGFLNTWASIRGAPAPPSLDLNPLPTNPPTAPTTPTPAPPPPSTPLRTINPLGNIVGEPELNGNYPDDPNSLLQSMASLVVREIKDNLLSFDLGTLPMIVAGAANGFEYTKAQTLFDALGDASLKVLLYLGSFGTIEEVHKKAHDAVVAAIAIVDKDYGAPPVVRPLTTTAPTPSAVPDPDHPPVVAVDNPGTPPAAAPTGTPPTTVTPPSVTPPPASAADDDDGEPDAPVTPLPGDPKFVGPLLPNSSPVAGSQGDYGQDVPYWPADGNPAHTDENGNPLPYGITRQNRAIGDLTPATISDLDPTLKEDLPAIQQGLHAWEIANGLDPTAMQINSGTNGGHSPKSQHYTGNAIDLQLPKNLTQEQLSSLAATLHTYVPGIRVGLNGGTAKAPAAVGTADFIDPGSPSHVHIDLKNIAPLQNIEESGTVKPIPVKNNIPASAFKAQLSAVNLRIPVAPGFINTDDDTIVTPSDNLIAAVVTMKTTPATAASQLSAVFANALKINPVSFGYGAAAIDSAFPKLTANLTAAQVAPLFAPTGPIAAFKPQYDAAIASGTTPGQEIAHLLKSIIG